MSMADRSLRTDAAKPLKAGMIAAFSATGLVIGALQTPLAVYLPNYYASHVGVAIGVVGMIFLLIKLLDIGFDPLMGMVMSRTRTPVGRYRFWLLVSAPIIMVATYMNFMAKPGVGEAYVAIWLAVIYAGFSLALLSQSAWGAVIAKTYNDRSKVFSWVQFVGVAGAVAVLLLPTIVGANHKAAPGAGVHAMGWFVILAVPITALIASLGTPEPLPAAQGRGEHPGFLEYFSLLRRPDMLRLTACDFTLSFGPGFSAPLYLFFFQQARNYSATEANYLLLIYIVAGLIGAPTWGWIARRVGKHRTLMAATVLYAMAQAALMAIPKHTIPLMAPGMFTCGFIANAFVFLVRAMVADVSDEVRLETGKDRTAMLYAIVTSTLKIGAALAVGVTFSILARIGFDAHPGAHNTPAAIHGLELCYVFVPVIMGLIGGATLIGYKLDSRKHAGIRAALDARDRARMQLAEAELSVLAGVGGGGALPASGGMTPAAS